MHEQPAASVDEETAVVLGEVSFSGEHVLDAELAGGKQVDAGDGAVADGNETLAGLHVDTSEVVEVLEEGAVRGSHGELDLGELGEDTEETEGSLRHHKLSVDCVG